jgi:hypothetical protein
MIDDWDEQHEAGKPHEFPIVLINDLPNNWFGTVRIRLLFCGKLVQEQKIKATIPALGRTALRISIPMPATCGPYQLEATLVRTSSGDVQSLRDFAVTRH